MSSRDTEYSLIDIDQFEPNIVRRKLRRLTESHEQGLGALVSQVQGTLGPLAGTTIERPRYETNVWPLYFYWKHAKSQPHKDVYIRTAEAIEQHFDAIPERFAASARTLPDAEIDILIEDRDYFVFVEAKNVPGGGVAKFETKPGVHQLVRQYLQGMILEKLIAKRFALATIGANRGNSIDVPLTDDDVAMLGLFGQPPALTVMDLVWPEGT